MAEKTSKSSGNSAGFTAEEKAAMKDRAAEMRAEAKGKKGKEDGTADVLAKIAEMPESDRKIAQRIHELITGNVPELTPKTWYGMQGYARDGKVVCFFQNAGKFKTRYSTLGFNDSAQLDEGTFWPTAYAVMNLNAETEKQILALVRKAVGG